ncbi:NAD dependent epimerase/dehydratase family protein [Shimia gijangensis]|uniref:NAD dependent epimerase/dehydratase family protein n=1 Tax=Shimia gijangensis TaxID=1470563 RepID=A0A1M6E0H5_9RHOB|nr:NAD-dependent epimerase/dehydratase family protein [Shimia gijangensis]SHI78903.1 NAD dependent epimerase/dehydratase family protein [Shimia gijangensis]
MTAPKAVVPGGSGFIGKACLDTLAKAGHDVIGVSRSRPAGTPHFWRKVGLGRLSPAEWKDLLKDAEVVVNADRALQDGARISLDVIHVRRSRVWLTRCKNRRPVWFRSVQRV